MARMQELLAVTRLKQQQHRIAALTFGVKMPNGEASFPSGPTWLLYGMEDTKCLHNLPVLMYR